MPDNAETAADYAAMTTIDLRKLARSRGLFTGHNFNGVSKASIVAVLAGTMTERDAIGAHATAQTAVNDGLASMIAAALAPYMATPAIDEECVIDLIRRHAPTPATVTYAVTLPTGEIRDCGVQHYLFPVMLAAVSARVGLMLVGPAGSGKSRAAREAATALGLAYEDMSVGPQTSKSDIFGYCSATGEYIASAFRRAYEHGGVFLFDEIDAAHPGVMTMINGATSNGHCTFPDRCVSRHADCIIMAAANTFGNGASRQYVGRNQLDAATMDRFAMLEWPYDDALESAMCGVDPKNPSPRIAMEKPRAISASERQAWLDMVQACRANVERTGLRHVVSPRASIMGIALLSAGVPLDMVNQMVLVKGLDADSRRKAGC